MNLKFIDNRICAVINFNKKKINLSIKKNKNLQYILLDVFEPFSEATIVHIFNSGCIR